MSNLSNMSNVCPPQQLTVNPDSRGAYRPAVWLAWCQQCELKRSFAFYNDCQAWVKAHRQRYDHRVQHGAGR